MKARAPAALAALALVGATSAFSRSAGAQVSEVSGGAFGHYTNVSLFGGPSIPKGPAPDVRLPPTGADPPLTARVDSASAVYGPAHIFAGKWPPDVGIPPPSGPITVTTRGKPGPGGSVKSTVDIVLRDPPDPKSPGGFGPSVPVEGDELHSECTATEAGATGSARFVNAVLATSTDESGEPKDQEPVPDSPPPNYTRTGQITNVGDNWKIVFNEQIVDPDGSITVNAVHMSLLGPIAVGEQILGQVRCSTRGAAFADTPPPTAQVSDPSPPRAADGEAASATEAESSGNGSLPFVVAGAAVAAGGLIAVLWIRRPRGAEGDQLSG